MLTISFQSKIQLNSFTATANPNQWIFNASLNDFEGVFTTDDLATNDILVLDSSSYRAGTLVRYRVLEVLSTALQSAEMLVEYVDDDQDGEQPDIGFLVGTEGMVTRPTTRELLPVVSPATQQLPDRFSFYIQNFNLQSLLNDLEDGKSAYEVAVENGFEGTEAEWLVSLVGEEGPSGKSAYELALENGFEGSLEDYITSLKGDKGDEGKSAYEIAVENGFEGNVEDWIDSLKGADGKSAYQTALDNGFEGTETEWLESLIGEVGKSAYQLAVDEGFEGTITQWLESLKGSDGYNGKSAYEVAVDNGYVGDEEDWLTSLKGDQGKSAYQIAVDEGYQGTEQDWLEFIRGSNGKSAYEVAVDNGFVGTEAEWLESIEQKRSTINIVRRTDNFVNNGAPGLVSILAFGTQEDLDAVTITQVGGSGFDFGNISPNLFIYTIQCFTDTGYNTGSAFTLKYHEIFGNTAIEAVDMPYPVFFPYNHAIPSVMQPLTLQNFRNVNGLITLQKTGLVEEQSRKYRFQIM